MSKPPSRGDGKPIGTPMDAKRPFHAGVTLGPDQIERMEAQRKLRNRAWKAAMKAERKARYANLTPEERERDWQEYKRRRNRADCMTRALRNGTPIPNIANHYHLTPDEVLSEVKWLSEHRNRIRSRKDKPNRQDYPPLPERKRK